MNEINSVAYKKSGWIRYLLWGSMFIAIICLVVIFGKIMHEQVSASVPEGYRFSVSDNKWADGGLKTVYYVYDDKILVEDMNLYADGEKDTDRAVMIYDDISTDGLIYDKNDRCLNSEFWCEPKILTTIKSLISRRVGRPYIGL